MKNSSFDIQATRNHIIMKSRLLLLGIFPILTIIMIIVVNANADAVQYNDPPIVSGCGQVHIRDTKIVGGHEAAFGSYPWHGAIFAKPFRKWMYYCGSSLLNDRWIVSAAHCMYTPPPQSRLMLITDFYIRLGEWKIYTTENRFSHEEFNITEREIHPQYVKTDVKNDIVLLKLDRTVSFKQHITPVCLPMSNLSIYGRTATIIGWGKIDYELKDMPDVLQEIDVEIITDQDCVEWYNNAPFFKNRSHPLMYNGAVCAGYKEGGRDSCSGDSGGGLTMLVGGKRVLIGIVSWGVECALPDLPGVYTHVQTFMPWIMNITN